MEKIEISSRIKTGLDLFKEETFTRENLEAHLLQLVEDAMKPAEFHKQQVERMLAKVQELRANQVEYWRSKKGLGTCKQQEVELDKKVAHLLRSGYSIEWIKNESVIQQKLM